jgi:hypothetical protein
MRGDGMSARGPIDVNPVDVAIEMLTEALPGFESRFVSGRDAVGIRGALPIAAEISRDMVMYPIYQRPVYMSEEARSTMDLFESDEARAIRHARQRETLLEMLAPTVNQIVETIHRLGIEALGLEVVIAERERRAAERVLRDGYGAGRADGIREGRVQVLSEIEEVRERIHALADAFGEAVPDGEE